MKITREETIEALVSGNYKINIEYDRDNYPKWGLNYFNNIICKNPRLWVKSVLYIHDTIIAESIELSDTHDISDNLIIKINNGITVEDIDNIGIYMKLGDALEEELIKETIQDETYKRCFKSLVNWLLGCGYILETKCLSSDRNIYEMILREPSENEVVNTTREEAEKWVTLLHSKTDTDIPPYTNIFYEFVRAVPGVPYKKKAEGEECNACMKIITDHDQHYIIMDITVTADKANEVVLCGTCYNKFKSTGYQDFKGYLDILIEDVGS